MSVTDLPLTPALAAGEWVAVSGQVGVRDGRAPSPSVGQQTRDALDNVVCLLAEHGLALGDVVKTTVFLTDMSHYDSMNEAYRVAFAGHLPARTCVAVAALPRSDAHVEIEAWARARR